MQFQDVSSSSDRNAVSVAYTWKGTTLKVTTTNITGSMYFITDSVQKLSDTPSYIRSKSCAKYSVNINLTYLSELFLCRI
jgi:hypothetical protein